MKKYIYISILLLLIALIALMASKEGILKSTTSNYIGKQLNADVEIDSAQIDLRNSIIKESGVDIVTDRGLSCTISDAEISYGSLIKLLSKKSFKFELKDFNLTYPNSKIINGIANSLSLDLEDLLKFDYVKGEFIQGENEIIIKALEAKAEALIFFADATIKDDDHINGSFKMLLSKDIIAGIPEAIRKVFFKQEGDYSEVTLYVTGSTEKPSINFQTDLFKFIVK